ncbi:molybdopterin-dependent oxidoreductase [Fusobacterium varium]|uniref:xanthine dehydrogenase family protein molybdopterin-binding subunit n=1 Tax=uncultured Fusobacterium sp. TaxID=159267 RepID=UPI00265E68BD|nr:molybdopterin cofactor-binding domain-containing protein [uncultured Fusobacterium sp.]MCF2638807.1 molybdopterin-dependent oxidoreductase [Fusobacterium varium]
MKIVNKSTKKIDSIGIITGRPLYTDDLVINNNSLIVKLLRSPHAYARIADIDTSIAKKVPGVEAIFTYHDVPNTMFTLAGQSYPEPSPYDRKILDEYVRYVGDPVAIIAAIDEKTAEKAMKLIKVKYEVLDAVIDYEKALDSDILVHREAAHTNFPIGYDNKRNLASSYLETKGDVEKGFAESDVIIEETYYTQPQIHAMMETYRTACYLDAHGRLNVISSTQIPFHVRRHLARALEMPSSRIRVMKPKLGGGFGGKQTSVCEIYPAFVTMKTGKPSKIVYTRKETQACSNTRHAMRLKVKIGSDREGNIKAIDINVLSNTGAYGEHAPTVTALVVYKTFPLYAKVPMRCKADIVYSNTTVGGAFRGYGATQGTFAVESAVNELAHKLGLDPTEVRMKNLVDQSETVSGDIKKCIEIGKEAFDWKNRCVKDMGNGKVRASGMAVTMQGSGIQGVDTASATLKLHDSGDYTLYIGVTDMGQGCDTVTAQMAAEILEVPMEKIIVNSADTDVSPYDPGAYASSGTYVTGNAVILAAKKMREEVMKMASFLMKTPIEELEYMGEYVQDKNGNQLSLKEIGVRSVSFEGMNQLTTTATWGGKTSPPPFIASFAEVEVDTLTGETKVIDFLSVVDCGLPINPALAQVQVEGGIAQGIGLALYEDIQFDERGKMKHDTLMQYKIPSRKDLGNNIKVMFSYSDEPTGPFGAKSIGEVVINTASPAIADAIYNATNRRLRSLPMTSEKIFWAINSKNN